MLKRKDTKNALDQMVASSTLTSAGKDWLLTSLDPFHDFNHTLAGYPDADVSQTIVACYQYEKTITKPTSAGVANWDCHVFTMPVLSSYTGTPVYNQAADWSSITDPAPAAQFMLAPININAVAAGAAFGPQIPNVVGNGNDILPANGTEDLLSGNSRIIAMGFEVHNTTAEIYKQGSVTTYRMPQAIAPNTTVWKNVAKTSYSTLSGSRIRAPPVDVASANLLKGTRTWEAKDGVYATVFQSSVVNPLRIASTVHTLVDPSADPGVAATVYANALTPVVPDVDAKAYTPYVTQTAPFDTTGAFFTGLSNQTSLQLKVRIYVERAPSWNEPNLAVLASPSAAYDVRALELYGSAINFLPPAVMVNENAMGDWWRAVTSVINTIARPLASVVGMVAPGLAPVANGIASIVGQIDPSKSVARQATAQNLSRVTVVKQQRPKLAKKKKNQRK